jgi:hypothetical protein
MVISYVRTIHMHLPYPGATKHLTYSAIYEKKQVT